MGRKSAQCSEEAKVEILAEQKKSHPPHIYRRLLALKFKAVDGMLSKEAGRITGLHETSVNRIVNRYQKEGMDKQLEYARVLGNTVTFHFRDGQEVTRNFKDKRHGAKWSAERHEKMHRALKASWTDERRAAASERMREIRSEKKWTKP